MILMKIKIYVQFNRKFKHKQMKLEIKILVKYINNIIKRLNSFIIKKIIKIYSRIIIKNIIVFY